jgi:hypothetical protein
VEIAGTTLQAEDIAWIEREGARPGATRSDLARQLCARKGLVDGRGALREVAARIDLCRQVRAGRLRLPRVRDPFVRGSEGRRSRPATAAAAGGSTSISLLTLDVRVVRGRRDPAHAIWKRALDEHHYLGAGRLCGAQLRYLVYAGDALVAAASFSAAARHVRCRDRFIGWSALARRRNRSRVIAQSRFCVVHRAPNLSSRVQSILLRRVAADWEQAYGQRPLLVESFVDRARFDGASYRAANWIEVGVTRGRGRQDTSHERRVSVKRVFVRPLDRRFRELLGVEPVHAAAACADWAIQEWGAVDLKDRRLTKRLVAYGRARFERLHASTPESLASRAATKGAYRLLTHEQASLESFLSAHREATLTRAAEHAVVLAIQDTTSLNYTTHVATTDLGPIATYGAEATLGLEVHSTLLSTIAGTPLGLLDVNAWARDPKDFGKAKEREHLPVAKKESGKWLRGYAAADLAGERLARTQVVVVGDREADMYELLAAAVKGKAQVLVRATQPRRIVTPEGEIEGYLWDRVRADPVAATIEVHVPRSGARAARVAKLALRHRAVEIARPRRPMATDHLAPSVKTWAIAASETAESAVRGVAPIEWLLLTTLPVESAASAAEKVAWYGKRWLIEVFHRTLKTGCQVERRQSKTAASLKAALAIDAIVAWRVLSLVKLSRETPDAPCTEVLADDEWKALHCFTKRTRTPPPVAPTLAKAVLAIAELGGFLGYKNPGAETVWKGLERLTDITTAYRLFLSSA